MGKYEKTDLDHVETAKALSLHRISNELAEQNRLRRLALEMRFRTQSNRALYRKYKMPDGTEHTLPPEDKQKEEWKEEQKAITKELKDQA